ncbi:MAG: hypothetical protein RL671_1355 [Pseudomonadota bacterium]|jgi:hypothetical protein|uniref:DUF3604 domain-containing protein n=1 Tax=Novosphingobium sp. APW14 TaxID=3077237 RepID=UPI0028DED57A|nr:DUF3604 domain-containing protein [Novosphingobium sp. APW14]MDT9012092.1 DUF3604 domain-containing protein [Novosphingobium sp. APW14]
MRRKLMLAAMLLGTSALVAGCDQVKQVIGKDAVAVKETEYPEKVLWGDTHVHTANSVDAFGFGVRLSPEDALRFARGEEVTSTTGVKAKLPRPLDFMVITDHAEGLGATKALYDAPRMLITDARMRRWYDMMHEGPEGSQRAMAELLDARGRNDLPDAMLNQSDTAERTKSVWKSNMETVEEYNEPGKFTAFHGFEYTLMQGGNNLHRNVIFRDGADKVKTVAPIDPTYKATPDEIWNYMEAYEKATGGRVLAIPHNSNLSNGLMFELTQPGGGPMTAAYAKRRAKLEPVVEITQIKGDSEAHPFLSPNDEFAGFGVAGWEMNNLIGNQAKTPNMYAGEYVREALKRGLMLEAQMGVNPYKFGVIGSTDTHTGLSTADDNQFFGKHSGNEPNPKRVMQEQNLGTNRGRFGWHYLASGYAAVWAKANTRAAIFDAMQRREVYASTGPRMTVRFFGGWDFKADDLKGNWVQAGYKRGVPMGGELSGGKKGAPSFIVSALKDPIGANLDRVQVVKGWVDKAGKSHEKVFNVVWSDPAKRKLTGGKLPAVGDTIDLATATYKNTIGAATLATVWTDPEFDPAVRAFYYVRVIEIPTPRWSAYDAVRFKLKLAPDVQVKQQERAYTSAIWYNPIKS